MVRKNHKKKFIVMLFILLIVGLGLGYAILTQKLTIDNIISYDSMKWDVGFTAAEDGYVSLIDYYIEWIEKEEGKTLEELGVTREELEAEMFNDVVAGTSFPKISTDKKSIDVNCQLKKSSYVQVCMTTATITNASTFNVAISEMPIITYDNTYIDYGGAIWFKHSLFSLEDGAVVVSKGQTIDAGESAEVLLVFGTKELSEGTLPQQDMSIPVTVSFEFEETDVSISQLSMLKNKQYDSAFWSESYRNQIKNITIQNKINIPENVSETWDISVAQDGRIMSFVVPNESDSTYYDLYIQSDNQLYAHFSMNDWFASFENLDSINGLELLDTSYTTDMSYMFNNTGDNSTEFTLDVSNFETSNVVYMNDMFSRTGYNSTKFTLDVSNFDTSKVTNMSYMFYYTGYNSTDFELDVSNFETSNVVYMNDMFSFAGYNSTKFTLDVSNFDTSNVTDMSSMFYYAGYSNPEFTMDVSNFDTTKVTDMSSMFEQTGYNSTKFTLDVSNFDTRNVTNMSYMFYYTGYNSTKFTLDVSNFDTSNVTDMSSMFYYAGYSNPEFTMDVSNFDTSKVTDMNNMFYYTGYNSTKFVTSITIRNPNVNSYWDMFYGVATQGDSKITVNYTSETSELVDNIINTKSDDSNVVKGAQVD